MRTAKLWDSWDDDALVMDREEPLFADPLHIHAAEHRVEFFSVNGPLNVPRPPQGYPVIIQAGASKKGKDFAARWADVIFCSHASLESAQVFYKEIKDLAVSYGRRREDIKVLPSITPIVALNELIAQAEERLLFDLAPDLAGLSTLAYHLDIDLSEFPLDTTRSNVEAETSGSASRFSSWQGCRTDRTTAWHDRNSISLRPFPAARPRRQHAFRGRAWFTADC